MVNDKTTKEIVILRCPECGYTVAGEYNQKLASLIVVQCPQCSFDNRLEDWREEGLEK